ncbi:MAG TPA: pseudouridine-5'-phosphate glycosidase, partial [Bacteroidia bacterium]|nr:pseudouridine-5'-phosphate glycosidase [Bacteroidia bacterium]
GIKGKLVTPFLLKRIAELSGGESLAANIALIKNNAALGGRIAFALSAVSK